MAQIMEIIIHYIESVDDENFLTTIMLEKDYTGRDALAIAVEMELLELIQLPKVEAIIKRIYHSDYELNGNLFEMSTSYQMVFGKSKIIRDIESKFRFNQSREIDNLPQTLWQLDVIKQSMEAKIQAMGIIAILYTLACILIYEIVITLKLDISPGLYRIV